MKNGGTTRRQFLKAAGGLGILAVGHPLLIGCGSSGTSDPTYARTIAEMTAFIEQKMVEDRITGAAIALVDDQRVVWARGFGYADAARGIPATSDTVFGIGSTSKTFAAAMVMQLADRGLVNLADPLTKYIPGFSLGAPLGPYASVGGPITIRTILTQHTGIPGDLNNGLFTSTPHPDFNSRMVDYLRGDHAQYPPDCFFAYSNTAVAFLADIIASSSGMSFLEYSQSFLRSLGMDRSSFNRDDPSVAACKTKTYLGGQEAFDGYINSPATGAMLSTVSDMAKYIKMIHAGGVAEGGRVLSPEAYAAMLSPQNTSVPLDFDFRIGYIWWLSDPDFTYAGRLCEHGGTTTMTKTMVKILLDHKLGVVLLTNSDSADALRNTVPGKTLALALEEKRGLRPGFTPEFSPVVTWSAERLDALAGIYIPTSAPVYWPTGVRGGKGYDRVIRSGTGLEWTQDVGQSSQAAQTLVPRANGRFSAPDSQEIEYEFKQVSGRDVMTSRYKGFENLKAERYVPAAIPVAWAGRVGTYALANLAQDDIARTRPDFSEEALSINLSINGDGILLMDTIVLAPVSHRAAYRPGLARDLGAAVQVVEVDGEEQVQCLGYRYRKAALPTFTRPPLSASPGQGD
ncbi:MAG: serine hydrolase domain-containing protein [Syntrophales bacterium]